MTPVSALVLSIPTRDSTVRMRVWRALKGTGCGVLRDGVYLLPRDAPTLTTFADVEAQVRAAGGFAMTVDLDFRDSAQRSHARGLFDRSAAYGELVARMADAKRGLGKAGQRKAGTAVRKLQKAFEELAALDYFPGEAQSQARAALEGLQAEARRMYSHGEPRAASGRIKRLDGAKYRGRLWATRKDLWIDRLASAWLIRRFIDKDARFAWIDFYDTARSSTTSDTARSSTTSPRHCPKNAVGFDFDGAAFTHVGSRVTFEVLLASFGLEGDPALASIGAAVHFLDAGGIPVADARGIETLIRGITQKARGDDERLSKANGVFDHLYAAYQGN